MKSDPLSATMLMSSAAEHSLPPKLDRKLKIVKKCVAMGLISAEEASRVINRTVSKHVAHAITASMCDSGRSSGPIFARYRRVTRGIALRRHGTASTIKR